MKSSSSWSVRKADGALADRRLQVSRGKYKLHTVDFLSEIDIISITEALFKLTGEQT